MSSRDRFTAVTAAIEPKIEVTAAKLQVLKDGSAVRILQKLYFDFVSDDDLSSFPDFIIELDAIFSKYRGNSPITEVEVENFEKDLAKSANKKPEQKAKEEKQAVKDAKIIQSVEKDDREPPVYDSSLAHCLTASLLSLIHI